MTNPTLNIVKETTDKFSIVFLSLVITLSSIWLPLLIGKLIFVYYNRKVHVGWLSQLTRINEIKQIALLFAILIFGTLTLLFHTAQEFELYPTQIENNCSENFIELKHLYDGLSNLCILMTISFVNIITIFFQKLYSKSKDLRLVRILVIINIIIKLPFLLIIGLFETSYIWVEMFVIACIFIEYIWLIRSEIILYRNIKDNLHDLVNSSLKSQTNWQEKKSINRKLFISFFIGFSFFLVSLPINWLRIYIDVAIISCPDDYDLPLQNHLVKLGVDGTDQILSVLSIIINILYIPLILMVVWSICLTTYWLLTKLMKLLLNTKNMRESSHLTEHLIQH